MMVSSLKKGNLKTMAEGYCVKCKKKRSMNKVVKKILGNRVQIKGVCSKCGTNMSTFASRK